MPTPWTVLASRTLVHDRFITVQAERVQTGSGVVLDPWYVVEAAHWVTIVPLLPDGRVVCVEQYRHGAQRVCLELPAGNIDPGEDAAAAALRELTEETGYQAHGAPYELGTLWPEPARSRATATGFLIRCQAQPIAQNLDVGEEIAVRIVTWEEAASQVVHACQLAFLQRALVASRPMAKS